MVSTQTRRQELDPDSREALLARLNELADQLDDDWDYLSDEDDPGEGVPDGTPDDDLAGSEYRWLNLGHEEPDPDPLPVNAAGMAAMVRFFALLEEERPAWQRDALCIEYEDLAWFPERGDDLRPLKDICARCLVRDECESYAVDQRVDSGVWGGESARRLKRTAAA